MTTQKRKNIFIPFFVALFALAFLLQRWLEREHLVDSIGLWYTIVCAFFYSAVVFWIAIGVIRLVKSK
ncbi:hypothetical protein [Kaarinaea lacus]